jgi:uncharacterized membrane protein YdjX (TVP38/TMEM64 family)
MYMQEQFVEFLQQYRAFAFWISVAANILISIFGVIPSVFLTAANLIVFGFWEGTFISFIGEAVGAAIAFLVYRKGFQRVFENKLSDYPSKTAFRYQRKKSIFTHSLVKDHAVDSVWHRNVCSCD